MKTLLLIIFVVITTVTNAQDGLGDFKLNKTKVEFVISKYPTFLEITDSNDCSLVRKFYCEKYEMLNVELKNIYLIFYNDYLVDFKCDREKLIDIYLASKYGRPKIQQTLNVVKIDNISYDEDCQIFEWKNRNINIVSTHTRRFNDYFNVLINSYLYIHDTNGIQKIKDCK